MTLGTLTLRGPQQLRVQTGLEPSILSVLGEAGRAPAGWGCSWPGRGSLSPAALVPSHVRVLRGKVWILRVGTFNPYLLSLPFTFYSTMVLR